MRTRKGEAPHADGFGLEVARWLRLALDSARTRGLNQGDVAREAGVSQDTLYRLLRGEGAKATEETIRSLARAAGVPVPAIERSLSFSDGAVGAPMGLALVRDAKASIEALERLLEREEQIRTVREVVGREEAIDEAVAAQKPGKGRRRAGGDSA
jgi:transcriptional regulator with XRE-family HTH domain